MKGYVSINHEDRSSFATSLCTDIKTNLIRESNIYFNLWRGSDLIAAMFLMLGIVTGTVNYEVNYPSDRVHNKCNQVSRATENFKVATMILTIASIIFLVCRYSYKDKWILLLAEIEKNKVFKLEAEKIMRHRRRSMWLEIALVLIFPYPYLDQEMYIPLRHNYETILICYRVSEFLYCIMFLRFYILLRAAANYSIYQNELASMYCRKYKVKPDLLFSFKCMLASNPRRLIFFIGISTIFITSAVCRIFERPLDNYANEYYSNPWNCVWYIFETISTLGFGEFTPISYFTRVDAVIAFFIGSILMSLTIASMSTYLELNSTENNVLEKIMANYEAGKVIRIGVPYLMIRKKFGKRSKTAKKLELKLVRAIDRFKMFREENITNNFNKRDIYEINAEILAFRRQIKGFGVEIDRIIKDIAND